ncbi:hypothetical protein C4H12_05575 [Capnocytophaga sp. oral taxon 878]|nr:hypothetical protein C4H12_05575 [Capnocytophaga sp. oral taxon 878]
MNIRKIPNKLFYLSFYCQSCIRLFFFFKRINKKLIICLISSGSIFGSFITYSISTYRRVFITQ